MRLVTVNPVATLFLCSKPDATRIRLPSTMGARDLPSAKPYTGRGVASALSG